MSRKKNHHTPRWSEMQFWLDKIILFVIRVPNLLLLNEMCGILKIVFIEVDSTIGIIRKGFLFLFSLYRLLSARIS